MGVLDGKNFTTDVPFKVTIYPMSTYYKATEDKGSYRRGKMRTRRNIAISWL